MFQRRGVDFLRTFFTDLGQEHGDALPGLVQVHDDAAHAGAFKQEAGKGVGVGVFVHGRHFNAYLWEGLQSRSFSGLKSLPQENQRRPHGGEPKT